MIIRNCTVLLSIVLIFAACRPENPVPKPRGYYRITFPEHDYQTFDSLPFPFSFDYPVYGTITKDEALNKNENAPYWINVYFKEWDATIYLSYKPITATQTFSKLVEESYKLSYKHDVRADYISTPPFTTRNGLIGVNYIVGGNTASTYQFFISDSSKNFIRGALYFNTTPNADSLKPATEFLKKDMDYLLETLQFR